MTIALTSATDINYRGWIGTVSGTLPTSKFSPGAGDTVAVLVECAASYFTNWEVPTITDTVGLTWTLQASQDTKTDSNLTACWLFTAPSPEAHTNMTATVTVEVTDHSQYLAGGGAAAWTFSGADTSSPLGAIVNDLSGSVEDLSVALTPTAAGSAICMVAASENANTISSGADTYVHSFVSRMGTGWIGDSAGPVLTPDTSAETITFQHPASATSWQYIAFEVVPGGGAPPPANEDAASLTYSNWTLSATGDAPAVEANSGQASSSYAGWALAASGDQPAVPVHSGAASLAYGVWTLAASGNKPVIGEHSGQASLSYGAWALAGTAVSEHSGQVSLAYGNWQLVGTADQPVVGEHNGRASLAYGDWSLAGTGDQPFISEHNGTVTLSYGDWTLVVTANAPIPGQHDGQATVSYGMWTLGAAGQTDHDAASNITYDWTLTAAAYSLHNASTALTYSGWVLFAAGVNPAAVRLTPLTRVFIVVAESRTVGILHEDRTTPIPAESRNVGIPGEDRTNPIAHENRTVTI